MLTGLCGADHDCSPSESCMVEREGEGGREGEGASGEQKDRYMERGGEATELRCVPGLFAPAA